MPHDYVALLGRRELRRGVCTENEADEQYLDEVSFGILCVRLYNLIAERSAIAILCTCPAIGIIS